jgi:hypothetical protein
MKREESEIRMINARHAIRSRWSTSQRLIATTLLSLLPVSTAAAQPGPSSPRPSIRGAAAAVAQSPLHPVTNATTDVPFFGPKKYVRTTGPKDVYTVTMAVPLWLKSPFRLHVQNGEADGTFRVSSATIEINNAAILTQSDFNQNVATFDRTVTLTASTILKVTLASKPTSYLTIWLYGVPAEHTPPLLSWITPAPGTTINTGTPQLLVRYSDPLNPEEPAASGVNLASLKVFIDDVDVSTLFTRRTDEASGEIPAEAPLAEGLHTFKASVADNAANPREITGQFRVDLAPPTLAFTAPAAGAYLGTLTPAVSVSYSDDIALDLTSIEVKVNDVVLPPGRVTASPDHATVLVDPLPEGPSQVTASIRDAGGNAASASVAFNVDVTSPTIAIAQPAAGARIGSSDVAVTVTWFDAQGVVPATATSLLDGTTAVPLVTTDDGATAQLTALPDGTHTFSATVSDRAGNTGTASVSFIIDTTVPLIKVTAPAAGAYIKTNTPQVAIEYSDDVGVVLDSLTVAINGADQTALFTKGPAAATAQVTAPLPEGTTHVAASIRDVTGNTASTVSAFVVDTIPPSGTIDAPGDRVRFATPLVTVTYADSGSGIDSQSVSLTVDGAPVSDVLSAGPDFASGTLVTPLVDGPHALQATFADRAANAVVLSKSFVVDTVPPQITVAVPANDTFVNTATPPLRVAYADPGGTGVDTTTLHLFLQKGSDPQVDVTSYVTITPTEATGLVPVEHPLADGTYRLRASILDRAGNENSHSTSFEVDTQAPKVEVETPAANGYVASSTPRFSILWSDALSGVDTATVAILIDDVNRTNRFTLTATGATGQLAAGEALSDGLHAIRVTLFDRAGNAAPVVQQTFTVDTIAPTVRIDAPENGGYVGPPPYSFASSYADTNSSGIDPAWVLISIDGIDRTADFTITPNAATATIATALAAGPHTMTVSVLDWAGNSATTTSSFTADAIAPVVAITSPAADSWFSGGSLQVTGTVIDASPVTIDVNGVLTLPSAGTFTATVPTTEGSFPIHATATDAAGNAGSSAVTVNVDSLAPIIHVNTPAPGFVTAGASFTLSGTIEDTSAVTLLLDGQPLALVSSAFSTVVPLAADGLKRVTLQATDRAGNTSTKDVEVTRDTVAPNVAVLSPGANSVVGALPIVVSGTLHDDTATTVRVDGIAATVVGESWHVSIDGLEEGPHTFAVLATDAAGNTTPASHSVTIDLLAPTITITAPASGTLTKEAATNVTGKAGDTTLVSVKLGELTATLGPGTTSEEKLFTFTAVPLVEGDNTLTAIATDALGRTSQAAVLVTRDSTVPILTVDAPELITRTRPSHASAIATDNLALRDVVFSLQGVVLATQTTAPFRVDVVAPSASQPGDVLTLTVVATDTAGNATTVTKSLRVTSDGAVTGLVLSNVTGLPIAGARVSIAGDDVHHITTDSRGRYALPANDQNLVLVIHEPENADAPMTVVERAVAIQSGVGTVPVDARLTPLGAAVAIGSGGGTLSSANVAVAVPGGALTTPTPVHLTLLGTQGVPNLLPMGWKPVASFDVRVDGTLAANVPFAVTISGVPGATQHLALYDRTLHAWTAAATSLAPAAGVIHTSLPSPGSYALIVADDPSVPLPVSGALLAGVAMRPIPDTATSSGGVVPPTIPPTGGSAVGSLTVHSPDAALPSGTVVQAEVTESFTMASGDLASEEKRMEDIVLFREGQDVSAQFPIVPSRSFNSGELQEGRVHLDILAGRESVRGRTGGSQALTLNAGDIEVTVPAGSLPEDLAISATPTVLSSFLPSTATVYPIAEVLLDFGGVTLGTSAVLSVSASGAPSTDTAVIARVERVAGVPKVVVVAACDRVNGRFVSKDLGSLAGIRRDGRYLFYRLSIPWSLLSGTVGLPPSTSSALVAIDGFPFIAVTNDVGDFNTIAPVGSVHLTASVPNTALSGETNVQVVSGQVAAANINLTAQPTTATVTPADGAIHVPRSEQIQIVASAPLRAGSANGSTFVLRDVAGASVALRFVFSSSGRTLAAVPLSLLEAGQTYTFTVSGLTDVYGGNVPIPSVTFTTEPETAPQYDTRKITFTMPGPNGLVTVSAPPGSLPPGTRVLIVNAGNGIVVSFTVGNDGSFTGTFPATINDRLDVTVTDPQGNIVQFTRSQFKATDGSGKTAIGSGGGIVEGPGGVELRIPEGALDQGAVFKIEAFGPEVFSDRPDFDGAHFGSGLRITSEQRPTLKKEGDLVFTRPADAPEGAFFYIYRRIEGPNGQIAFQTIDQAFDDGHGKIVTASFPFIGWKDSVAAYQAQADLGGLAFGLADQVIFFMMWSWDALFPGLPVQGAITGHVLRPVFDPGSSEPRYEPVAGALVARLRENGVSVPITIAITENDGHFVLWDSHYTGGTVDVHAHLGNDFARGTAFEANVSNTRANVFAALYNTYGYAAEVNLTFPAQTAPPPSPDVEVRVMTLDESNNLRRNEINGVVAAETPLLIGFKFRNGVQGEILNATINGEEFAVRRDDGGIGTGELSDFIVSTLYTPRNAGTFVIKATALNPLGGAPTEAEHTFLVVAGGGSNNVGIPNEPPDWITRKLVPKPNAVGVAVDVLPQVVFTEPVTNVVAGLTFTAGSGAGQYKLSAVGLDAQGHPRVIDDLRVEPADTKVTAITLIPLGGLDFGTAYTLRLTSAILDTDTDATGAPAPRSFPGRELKFTTIDPSPLGDSPDTFFAPAVAVLGDFAYVAKQTSGNGLMVVYDISDPEEVHEVGRNAVLGIPTHLVAEAESPVNEGQPVVAVGAGLKLNPPGPSNVYLFDVRNPALPEKKAIVTVNESAEDGIVLRLAIRKTFLYTITFPKGIQVIDLQRATDDFARASADPTARQRMFLDSVVAGRGFGQDAVVNTVQVMDPNSGFRAHLMDLAAAQYNVGGSNRTLVIATGSTPFVILDPTETSVRSTSAPPTAQGNLEFGRALTLARIANRDLALMIGTGQARDASGALTSGTALYVYDMVNPLVPNLIGSRIVDGSASDVEVTGSTAVVATTGGAMTFSLADPTAPRYLGTVEGVGFRIAIGAEGGYLVSTGTTTQSGAGLHVASFKPVVIIKKADPVMITVDGRDGQVTAPQKVNATESLNVNIKVIPNVSGLNGTVTVSNKSFPRTDGSDGGASTEEYPITWTNLDRGEGRFTLPAGRQYEDTDLVANANVDSDNGTLRSVPRSIKLGWVRLEVDSNNNTEIDTLDREAARKGRAFAFWESDAFYDLKRIAGGGKTEGGGGDDKGLTDYFTVRITVNKLWQSAHPGSFVRLWLGRDSEDAEWRVVVKKAAAKDYLRDKDAAATQVTEIVGAGAASTPACQASNEAIHNEAGECRPNGGYVTLPPLRSGTYEILVRCLNCLMRDPANLTSFPKMWLDYVPGQSSSSGVHIDETKVEIRPVRQWITYMSARTSGDTMDYKPLPELDPGQRPTPYLDDREGPDFMPDERQFLWANRLAPLSGQPARVPEGARDLTVIVHGYNVPDSDMRTQFLPTVFKRLYWVGHPVLRRQGDWRQTDGSEGCVKNCAHTVGISWPGNYLGAESGQDAILPIDSLSGVLFPENEFRAFATGPAIAKYLTELKANVPSRRVSVLAHSLGNLAMNSALLQPGLAPKAVDRYVMNEAAIPAEAVDSEYPPDALVLWGERHAQLYGFSDDAPWDLDWETMLLVPGGDQLLSKWLNNVDKLRKQGSQSGEGVTLNPQQFYTHRWRQMRPLGGLPVQSDRGPWRGLFDQNRTRTRIFNTYSENDLVLRVMYRVNQLEQKPLARFGRLFLERGLRLAWRYYSRKLPISVDLPPWRSQDNVLAQNWAMPEATDPKWDSVFGGTGSGHWTTKRQWGEVSYWFPSTSYPAGTVSLDNLLQTHCVVDTCNTKMTPYSAYNGTWSDHSSALLDAGLALIDKATHSYLGNGFFSKVYPAYDEIRKMFDPKN